MIAVQDDTKLFSSLDSHLFIDSFYFATEQRVPQTTKTDQGPYEFRKVLKPPSSSRNTTRSEDRVSDHWMCASSDASSDSTSTDGGGGPFDFRKLLRRTNHAPTDTLKRCKGLVVSSASESSV